MAPALAHSFASSSSLGGLLNRVTIGSSAGSSSTGAAGGVGPSSNGSGGGHFWDRSSSSNRRDASGDLPNGLTLTASHSAGGSHASSSIPVSHPSAAFFASSSAAPSSSASLSRHHESAYSAHRLPPPSPTIRENQPFPPPLEPRSYTVLKEVGDGSFGTVWLADWHSALTIPPGTLPPGPSSRAEYKGKQLVAIKRMKKAFEGGWDECMKLKELKSLRQIPMHPNTIPLYDAFLLPSTKELYFVFECMEGNLYQLTKSRKGRPLASGLTASIFRQILEGLDHIHKHGYFHRDMKPENLLITTTGLADYPASSLYALPGTPPEKDVVVVVKLADFGLAREINSRPPYTEYVSTRWYRAPEVLLRARDYSAPVDMWALGTIMVETITLKPLFPGDSEIDQVYKICEVLGDPSPDYGVDERGRPRGGGMWNKGAQLAKAVGFAFPKMVPRSLSTLFDSSTVPAQLIDCIADLMLYEPKRRLTTQQCLNHPYFRDVAYRYAPYGQANGHSTPTLTSQASAINSRTLPPSHGNGTPAFLKPPFQSTPADPTQPSLPPPSPDLFSTMRDPLNRHLSVDSSVSGMSGYGVRILPPPNDFDSPMVFPENVGEGRDQFSSPMPSPGWNGQNTDPNWGRQPIEYHPPHQQTQFHQQRRIPAFGAHGRRSSFSSSIAPSIAASTFYDGSIFEGIAPVRASSIMSFPAAAFNNHNVSPTPSFPDSPAMQREFSGESATPSQNSGVSSGQPTKNRGWGFFSNDKTPSTPALAIVQQHVQQQNAQAQAQAQALALQPQTSNPLKRTPSNASTRTSADAHNDAPRLPLDPKKAKKEAEKLAKEAEKLKREMLQQASRERARAVMKKRNQLMEAADPLHNYANQTPRVAGPDKGKGRASDRPSGGGQSSKSSIMSGASKMTGKMPQIAEDPSRLHVMDNRFKSRRLDDDDDVHSVSSNETGHSSQRGRPYSIASQATSASDPQPRHHYPDKTIPRVPSLQQLPSSVTRQLPPGPQSPAFYPHPPNTGHSSLDHQLIKNMQSLATSGDAGWHPPGRPQSRSVSPRDSVSSEARFSPYGNNGSAYSSSRQGLPPIASFDNPGGQHHPHHPSHMRSASQATQATHASVSPSLQSYHSSPGALPSSSQGHPQLPYLPVMDGSGTPSPGLTFPLPSQQQQHRPQ